MNRRIANMTQTQVAPLPLLSELLNLERDRAVTIPSQCPVPELFALRQQWTLSPALMLGFVRGGLSPAVNRDHPGPNQEAVAGVRALRQLPALAASVAACCRSSWSRALAIFNPTNKVRSRLATLAGA